MKRVLSEREFCDFYLLVEKNAFHPFLETYMTEKQYLECLQFHWKTSDIFSFPIPIVLSIMQENVLIGDIIELYSYSENESKPCAKLEITEYYKPDLYLEMKSMTEMDSKSDHLYYHEYIRPLENSEQEIFYVTGKIFDIDKSAFRLFPGGKEIFKKTTKNMVAFQTRNPLHQAHVAMIENTIKQNIEEPYTFVLNPTIGPTQPGDIPIRDRLECYQVILPILEKKLKNCQKVFISMIPLAMRMVGPREALFHSIIRKNYGFTHFIVGRDHAGPSVRKKNDEPWYLPDDAIKCCKKWENHLGGIKILPSEEMVYDLNYDKYVPISQSSENVAFISGSKLREYLKNDEKIPKWFSYDKVLEILKKEEEKKRGICLQITGLSGSGKSTLAENLKNYLQHFIYHHKKVQILDGDILRNYFNDLGFDKKSRSIQTQRIGFLASLLLENGCDIVICSNIAPYEEDRKINRKLLQDKGFIYYECYLSTPLEICELRDPKGLYKKVRQGKIQHFTGIDDPYEIPINPEIEINTGQFSISESIEKILSSFV